MSSWTLRRSFNDQRSVQDETRAKDVPVILVVSAVVVPPRVVEHVFCSRLLNLRFPVKGDETQTISSAWTI
jgi:hypothetical protein